MLMSEGCVDVKGSCSNGQRTLGVIDCPAAIYNFQGYPWAVDDSARGGDIFKRPPR